MQIVEVNNPATTRKWMDLPWKIYANDSNWIPHLRQDIAKVFDKKANKFYREGDCVRWILLDEFGNTIGRVAAFYWKKYSGGQKQPTGGLGFFECIEDKTAAFKLMDAACNWLRDKGMEAVDGPINFGEKDAFWGLLVENFTDMSSYRMNYNPPYYREFFESYGFQLYFQQFCYKRSVTEPAQPIFVRKAQGILSDPNYTVTNARGMSLDEITEKFVTVYNAAWAGHLGFKKMPLAQGKVVMKSLKPVMDKDVMFFIHYQQRPVAFYLNMPELNEVFQYVNGNLNWWGKLIFLLRFKFGKRHTMVGMLFGVDREFQGKGIEGALIKWAEIKVVPLNRYVDTILTWVGDFNPKMVHLCENLGAHRYRNLITYRKLFDETKEFSRHPMIG